MIVVAIDGINHSVVQAQLGHGAAGTLEVNDRVNAGIDAVFDERLGHGVVLQSLRCAESVLICILWGSPSNNNAEYPATTKKGEYENEVCEENHAHAIAGFHTDRCHVGDAEYRSQAYADACHQKADIGHFGIGDTGLPWQWLLCVCFPPWRSCFSTVRCP